MVGLVISEDETYALSGAQQAELEKDGFTICSSSFSAPKGPLDMSRCVFVHTLGNTKKGLPELVAMFPSNNTKSMHKIIDFYRDLLRKIQEGQVGNFEYEKIYACRPQAEIDLGTTAGPLTLYAHGWNIYEVPDQLAVPALVKAYGEGAFRLIYLTEKITEQEE